jgi:hypothetical protein
MTTVMVPADGSASGDAWRDLMPDLLPPTQSTVQRRGRAGGLARSARRAGILSLRRGAVHGSASVAGPGRYRRGARLRWDPRRRRVLRAAGRGGTTFLLRRSVQRLGGLGRVERGCGCAARAGLGTALLRRLDWRRPCCAGWIGGGCGAQAGLGCCALGCVLDADRRLDVAGGRRVCGAGGRDGGCGDCGGG